MLQCATHEALEYQMSSITVIANAGHKCKKSVALKISWPARAAEGTWHLAVKSQMPSSLVSVT